MNSDLINSFGVEYRVSSLSSCGSEDLFSNASGQDKSYLNTRMGCIDTDAEKSEEISNSCAEINTSRGETDLIMKLNPILKNIDSESVTFQSTPSVIVDSFYREGIESDSAISEEERLDNSAIVDDVNKKITCVEESDKSGSSVIESSDGDDDNYKSSNVNVFNSTKKQVVQKWLRNFSLNSTSKSRTEYAASEKTNDIVALQTDVSPIGGPNLKPIKKTNINKDFNLNTESQSKSISGSYTNVTTSSNKSSTVGCKELSINKNLSNIKNHEHKISPKCERRYNLRRNRREGKENQMENGSDDEKADLRRNGGKYKSSVTSFSTKANSKISFRHKKKPLNKVGKFADEDDFMTSIIDSVMSTKLSSDDESIIPHRISDVKHPSDVNGDSRLSMNMFTPRRKLFFRKALDNSLDDDTGSEVPVDIQPLTNNAVTSTPLIKPSRLKGLTAFLNQTLSSPLHTSNSKQDNPSKEITDISSKLKHNFGKEAQTGTVIPSGKICHNTKVSNKLEFSNNSGTNSSRCKEVSNSKSALNKFSLDDSKSLNSAFQNDEDFSQFSSENNLSNVNGSKNINSFVSQRKSGVTNINESLVVEDDQIQEPTQNNQEFLNCDNSLRKSAQNISDGNVPGLFRESSSANTDSTQADSNENLIQNIYDKCSETTNNSSSVRSSGPFPENESSDEVSFNAEPDENESFTMKRRSGKRTQRFRLNDSELIQESGRILTNSLHDNSSNETPFRRNSSCNSHTIKVDNIDSTELENHSTKCNSISLHESSENNSGLAYNMDNTNSPISGLFQQSIECGSQKSNNSDCSYDNEESFAGIDSILNSSNCEPIKVKEILENVVSPSRKSDISSALKENTPMQSFTSPTTNICNSVDVTISTEHSTNIHSEKNSSSSELEKASLNSSSNKIPKLDSENAAINRIKQNNEEIFVFENHADEVESQCSPESPFVEDETAPVFNSDNASNIGNNSGKHSTHNESVIVLSDTEDSFTRIYRSKTPLKKNRLNDSIENDFVVDLTSWADGKGMEIPKRTSKKKSEEKYDPDVLIVKNIDTSWSDSSITNLIDDGSVGEISSNEDNDDSEPWIDLATYLKKNVPAMSIPLNQSTAQKKQKTISEIVLPGHSPCPEHTSFLLSLTEEVPEEMCHPEAIKYRESFETHKNNLIDILFKLYNQEVFYNKLPLIEIKWSGHLTTTSGITKSSSRITKTGKVRTSSISLSKTVVNCASILRDVLIHELCHAANWLIDEKAGGHGPLFRKWADRVWTVFPEIPKVNVCHNYELKWKYIYKCTYCGHEVGKMKLSLKEYICRLCGGRIAVNT